MDTPLSRQEGLQQLRDILASGNLDLIKMIEAGPGVRERYQPVFQPHNLPNLTKDDFLSFLNFKNNQHWIGLHRKGPEICSNMDRLRTALGVLLDKSRPIHQRLDDLQPGGQAAVPGMGRAIITAILLVTYPDKYGVWNNRSQSAMEALGFWPRFDRGKSFGRRYDKVNAVLLEAARDLSMIVWTLDGLWWRALEPEDEIKGSGELGGPEDEPRFALERHLHEFLRDNWEKTELGRQWDLYEEDGKSVGYEYITPIGRIDLLARHKQEKAWLVVEIKLDQSSDNTIGQALRYMGYVQEHLAKKGDRVEGLIIAHAGDDKLRYAMTMVPVLRLMVYEVDFRADRTSGN